MVAVDTFAFLLRRKGAAMVAMVVAAVVAAAVMAVQPCNLYRRLALHLPGTHSRPRPRPRPYTSPPRPVDDHPPIALKGVSLSPKPVPFLLVCCVCVRNVKRATGWCVCTLSHTEWCGALARSATRPCTHTPLPRPFQVLRVVQLGCGRGDWN